MRAEFENTPCLGLESGLREREDPVELCFTWTEADLLEAMPLAYGRNRWIWAFLLGVPAVVFAAMFALGLYADPSGTGVVMLVTLGLYLLAMRHSLLRSGPRKQFRNEPALQREIRLAFDEDGMAAQTVDTEGRLTWEAFDQAVETEHLYVLFQNARLMNVVPKRAFLSPGDEGRFRGLLRRHVPSRLWSDARRFSREEDPAETFWH